MKKVIVLSALLMSSAAFGFGSTEKWASGWGQGVSEFIVLGKGQSSLYLSCEDSASRAATMIFTDIHGNQVSSDTGKQLEIKIDSNEKVSMGDSESHAGSDNFGFGWNQLRKGKKVIVSGDGVKAAAFTLQGASEVIPEFGTDGCISGFAAP